MNGWIGAGLVFGAGLSVFKALQVIFGNIEKYLSKEAKTAFAATIRQSDLAQVLARAPSQFTAFFDIVFGKSWINARFYYRSALLSTVTVLLVFIVAMPWFKDILGAVQFDAQFTYVMFFVSIFLVNIVVDMISIAKTRLVIRKIGPDSSLWFLSALLILDILLSITIYCVVFSTFVYAHSVAMKALYMGHTTASLADFVQSVPSYLRSLFYEVLPKIDDPCAGQQSLPIDQARAIGCRPYQRYGDVVSFYSSFAASIWLWIYMIAICLFKVRFAVGSVHRTVTRFFDFDNHPIGAVGLIVSGVACMLVWAIGLLGFAVTMALSIATGIG